MCAQFGQLHFVNPARTAARLCCAAMAIVCLGFAGCGTTINHSATEQLLASDAVDRSIDKLRFEVLTNQKVYLDTQYVKHVKSTGFVNSDYIVSAVRQQLVACGCLIQEDRNQADYIAEVRVGALGTDTMEITYGIPASNALNTAASLISSAPAIPSIPEISFAKKNDYSAAAKIAVFAYHRDTREPVWQSGMAESRSLARDTWILGAGPFQKGTIYDKTKFAGTDLQLPFGVSEEQDGSGSGYVHERIFKTPGRIEKQVADAKSEAETSKQSKEPVAKKQTPGAEPKAAAATPKLKNLQSAVSSNPQKNPT